jgi:hypothetical protein
LKQKYWAFQSAVVPLFVAIFFVFEEKNKKGFSLLSGLSDNFLFFIKLFQGRNITKIQAMNVSLLRHILQGFFQTL